MDLDGVVFGSLSNSVGGDVDSETRFHYRQDGSEIWADYSGGSVQRGFLVGVRCGDDLSFRYVHLTVDGEISSGRCKSTLSRGDDGILMLDETWTWESREGSGTSRLQEIKDLGGNSTGASDL